MDPITGQIAGSVIGGLFANKAAKSQAKAMGDANRLRMMPYTDLQPYLLDFYEGGTDAFKDALDKGYYQGDTLAGMDPRTKEGLNAGFNFGKTATGDATSFMDTARGFGSNYADLYNRASQDMLGNATQYATNNVEPLLSAAMRDQRRQLEERDIPGNNQMAQGTGNTNSSRAGVMEGMLRRGYDDREADMRTSIMDRLTDRSMRSQQQQLANMTAANQNLAGLFSMGFGMGGKGAAAMTGAGDAFRADEQARLDDERRRFEGERDFASNMYGMYGKNIIGAGPGGSSFGSIQANTANPYTAALSGAMAGFGAGGNIMDYFGGGAKGYMGQDGYRSFNPTPTVPVSSYY
jgi:hypothetical protein